MQAALRQAHYAEEIAEVPIGAIVVKNLEIIGVGFNQNIALHSVSSHAEINALNQAGKFLQNYRLINCDIYVTVEPCHMCAKAIVDARVKNLYFATPEPKSGAIISIDNFLDQKHLNHSVTYEYGILQEECGQLMKDFFAARRP